MTYRGSYRGAYSALVEDQDFQHLSPASRHVLLTLRLSPQNNAASIFRFYPTILESQTGYSSVEIEAALLELANSPSAARPWIFRENHVLWIRNGLKFDPNINLANENHKKAIIRALHGLPRNNLLAKFCKYYHLPMGITGLSRAMSVPFGSLSNGLRVTCPPSRRRSKSKKKESESPPLPPRAVTDDSSSPVNPGVESTAGVLDREHPSRKRGAGSGQAVHIGNLVNGALPRQPIGRYGEILQRVQAEQPDQSPSEQEALALAAFDRELKGAPR